MEGAAVDSVPEGNGHEKHSLRSRAATALSSKPVQPAWGLSAGALLAFGLGFLAARAAGLEEAALGGAITALFVGIAGLASPKGLRFKAAGATALIVFLGLILAHLTTGEPIVAGVAMALVMFSAAIVRAAGPVPALLGVLLGAAYFIPATIGYTTDISTPNTLLLGLVGIAAGLVTVIVLARPVDPIELQPGTSAPTADTGGDESGTPLQLIGAAIRGRTPIRAYAFRRGLVIGVAVAVYLATGNHNAFWIALTIFVVLGPDEASTLEKALNRSVGTIAGALLLGALAQFLPTEIVVGIGVIALVISVAFMLRNYAIYSAGIAMLIVALFGASDQAFIEWAGLRILDTLIGATIAIASLYLLPSKPGEKPSEQKGEAGAA
ncbi:MAG: FUSC family protein [Solirubrobacterales bacterium]